MASGQTYLGPSPTAQKSSVQAARIQPDAVNSLSLRAEGNVPGRAEKAEEQQTEGYGHLLGHHGAS